MIYCPGAMLDINGVSLSPQQALNIISMIRWILTSRLSIKNSISLSAGNVVYCPGAMLDINGVMLALARECENVDTIVCVSAFEVETLTSNFQVLPSSSISHVWRK